MLLFYNFNINFFKVKQIIKIKQNTYLSCMFLVHDYKKKKKILLLKRVINTDSLTF